MQTNKLREALIKARSAICQFARHQCQSLSWENSNIQANCGDVLCSWRGLCDAKTAINAALAAPQRNFERFQTKDAAREAFQKLRGHRVWADVSLWDDRDEIEAFLDWLFALGKEGGAR